MDNSIRILDGGFGTESIKLSKITISGHKLWSARLLKEDPKLVKQIHLSFLMAGSTIIETNTYQANLALFMKHYNISHADAIDLFQEAVNCANGAIYEMKTEKKCSDYLIAGSVGPYGAFLPGYAEYTGDYVDQLSMQELMDWHRPQVSALVTAGVSYISFDTMPALQEIEAVCSLMREFPNTTATVCVSSRDGLRTPHGETLSDVGRLVANYDQINGVGVNCAIHPAEVSQALLNLSISLTTSKCKPKVLIAMPNRGEDWNEDEGFHYSKPEYNIPFGSYADDWITKGGARWIGGCCRVSPEDIRDLVTRVQILECAD